MSSSTTKTINRDEEGRVTSVTVEVTRDDGSKKITTSEPNHTLFNGTQPGRTISKTETKPTK
ncbi:hypothetical protein [Methylobacter tundripaludum]|uniref:Uncharacterized protein n=1 Tax=Methylobacter tundripaludum (strain ATCC BAA-1195 / DSM 17260 / SV96) TaxID=697282 RepID=G3IVZ3_METTV|nr:hypothetical protein [Methylobacter tundripaludum]EGW23000.1 hypothetical protein Mettu_1838 [Methylobacter tundripaludum SV96]